MPKLPQYITKYFWGDDLKTLNWEKHQDYIARTILEKGNTEAVHWLMSKTTKKYLQRILDQQELDPKSQHFWHLYLS